MPMIDRYVAWIVRHAWAVVLASAGLAIVAAILASQLELRTDLAELLPTTDPSVREVRRLQARLRGREVLLINIHSPDRQANVRFADALSERLQKLPPEVVHLSISHVRREREWFENHKWLYPSVADIEHMRNRLEAEIEKHKNPLFIDLDDDGESLEAMKKRFEDEKGGALQNLPNDHFLTADGETATVIAIPPGGVFHERAGENLAKEVQRVIDELEPVRYGPLEVGFSGDVQSFLEEREALENDLVWATTLCILLVCMVVALYYRRISAVLLMAIPAFVGTLIAFAIAECVFGYLNSSTAFLGSIIVGNGINFAIIQLARYEEERSRDVLPAIALGRAVSATVRATAIAALAASIAYGSLVVTHFRGFSQFGVIGGLGMLLCWLASFTLLPALLWLAEQKRLSQSQQKHRGPLFADMLARAALRKPRRLLWLGGLLSLVSLVALPRYLRDPFEYNFRNLRSAKSDSVEGEGRWQDANRQVFGRTLNPVVLLADRREQVSSIRQALEQADASGSGQPMLGTVITLDDLVPGTVAEQQKKIVVLGQIRELLDDPSFELLDEKDRKEILAYSPPNELQPVRETDLPPLLRLPFSEINGRLGQVMLVYPQQDRYSPWDGRDMMRLAERVGELRLADGSVIRSAGTAVVFAAMIRSILHDGPLATTASALGVVLIVLLLARPWRGALIVLGALVTGMLWMMGGAAALDLRLNFLNFVAIPITLGIGIDYGINIYQRSQLEGPGRLYEAVRATGGAVALCSMTTIIGYGSLLVADNRGLRSFGELAILGELACLAAALVCMPALLAVREGYRLPESQ